VTDRDIVIRAVAYGHDLGSAITDYASGNVFTMDCSSSVQDAAQEMAGRQLRRLPVTEDGKVVGIVALADLATNATGRADEQALQGISQPTI
jgi:signal-transduction protein with cAMP-binding, CBS, and nucleotidyltransferase domain